jgi:hypothetical protein
MDHDPNVEAAWSPPYLGELWYCTTSLEGVGSFLSLSDNSLPPYVTCRRVSPDLVNPWGAGRFAALFRRLIQIIEDVP